MNSSRSRLTWLCRRGTRELDLLLEGYLEQVYDDAPVAEKEAFTALLDKSDSELQSLLFQPTGIREPAWTPVVERILAAAASEN